jgi:hypothetical protein
VPLIGCDFVGGSKLISCYLAITANSYLNCSIIFESSRVASYSAVNFFSTSSSFFKCGIYW